MELLRNEKGKVVTVRYDIEFIEDDDQDPDLKLIKQKYNVEDTFLNPIERYALMGM